jgi:hypothetical protein
MKKAAPFSKTFIVFSFLDRMHTMLSKTTDKRLLKKAQKIHGLCRANVHLPLNIEFDVNLKICDI